MADQDKILVKHVNGSMEITVTPAGGVPASITITEGEQVAFLRAQLVTNGADETEHEGKFNVE